MDILLNRPHKPPQKASLTTRAKKIIPKASSQSDTQALLAAGNANALNLPIPLTISYGGTGSTSYTAGSVIFAGTSGTSLTQNNAQFFWDNTNHNLYIGANTSFSGAAIEARKSATGVQNVLTLLSNRSFTSAQDGVMIIASSPTATVGIQDYGVIFMGSDPLTGDGGAALFQLRAGGNASATSTTTFLEAIGLTTGSLYYVRLLTQGVEAFRVDVNQNTILGYTQGTLGSVVSLTVTGRLNVLTTASTASILNSQTFYAGQDVYPTLHIVPTLHNNITLNFDAYTTNGVAYFSSVASTGNFQIAKGSSILQFNYANAAQAAAITWTVGLSLNTSGQVNIPSLTASANSPVFTDASSNLTSTGVVPIAHGGTNASSQVTNGVNYFNGTSITTDSVQTFAYTNGTNFAGLQVNASAGTTPTASLLVATNNPGAAVVQIQRPNNTGQAYLRVLTNSSPSNTSDWQIGVYAGNDIFTIRDGIGNVTAMTFSTSGVVNVPSLTASSPVFTDASSNLTSTGVVSVAHGGTGISSGTQGGIPYFSASTTIASSAALTANQVVIGSSTGLGAPTSLNAGLTGQPLVINASGNPIFGPLPLATAGTVTGLLPILFGGTNASTQQPSSVNYYNGTSITSDAVNQFQYTSSVGSNTLALTVSTAASASCIFSTNAGGTGSLATINVNQASTIGSAVFSANSHDTGAGISLIWTFGLPAGTDNFQLLDQSTPGGVGTVLTAVRNTGDVQVNAGNLQVMTATKGLQIKSAAVATGSANSLFVTGITLVAGTATITDASVTAAHIGFVTSTASHGTTGFYRVTTAASSFTVTSSSTLDTSFVAVLFILPL